jgi:hypothetical protein
MGFMAAQAKSPCASGGGMSLPNIAKAMNACMSPRDIVPCGAPSMNAFTPNFGSAAIEMNINVTGYVGGSVNITLSNNTFNVLHT